MKHLVVSFRREKVNVLPLSYFIAPCIEYQQTTPKELSTTATELPHSAVVPGKREPHGAEADVQYLQACF